MAQRRGRPAAHRAARRRSAAAGGLSRSGPSGSLARAGRAVGGARIPSGSGPGRARRAVPPTAVGPGPGPAPDCGRGRPPAEAEGLARPRPGCRLTSARGRRSRADGPRSAASTRAGLPHPIRHRGRAPPRLPRGSMVPGRAERPPRLRGGPAGARECPQPLLGGPAVLLGQRCCPGRPSPRRAVGRPSVVSPGLVLATAPSSEAAVGRNCFPWPPDAQPGSAPRRSRAFSPERPRAVVTG